MMMCSPFVEVQNPEHHTQMYKIQPERITTENKPPTETVFEEVVPRLGSQNVVGTYVQGKTTHL